MSEATKDYVRYGSSTGKALYVARVYRPILEEHTGWVEVIDHEYGPSRTFPNVGLAKSWLRKRLTELGDKWSGAIEMGRYEDCSFHDSQYGHILDVTWEQDYSFELSAWWEDDGLHIG